MNRTIKKTLKMVPKTSDDEFDRRVATSKGLHTALKMYESAVNKAKSSLENVADRLIDVKKALLKLTDSCNSNDGTTNTVNAFSASVERIKSEVYAEFARSMDQEILASTHEIKGMESDCDKAESERQKLRKDFDVYRELVRQKESEYSKKGKDLTESKSYGSDVVKRNELEQRFYAADEHFKDLHSQFLTKSTSMTTQSICSFLNTWYNFFNRTSAEFGTLVSAAQNTTQDYNAGYNQMGGQTSSYALPAQQSAGEGGYSYGYD